MSPTLDLSRDYFCFVMAFFDMIKISAPHIYVSALPLSPHKSLVYNLYKQYAHPLVRVVQGLPMSWDVVLTTIYCGRLSRGVAWSPCSKFIAVATWKSGVIEILDGATLEHLNTLKSPEDSWCEYLLFSPDGCTLTQHGEVKLVHWDLQTGVPISTPPSAEKCGYTVKPPYAYSVDGRILVVLRYLSPQSTLINTYDLLSGTHTGSHPPPEQCVIAPFWTHDECLHFATVKPGSITIWEAAFTLVDTPTIVKTLPAPDELTDHCWDFLFLPSLSQLAFTVQDMVFIWDAQYSRFLLKSGPYVHAGSSMSFSSDGHFFSHISGYEAIYVWKRSPSSYVPHQKVAFPLPFVNIHLSPDGRSIIAAGDSSICLWHTRDQVVSDSRTQSYRNFLLEFSPSNMWAGLTRLGGNAVTILNLQSGDPQLVIDTGIQVECLMVTESVVTVASKEMVITWNIPTKNCVNPGVGITEGVHTTMLSLSDPLTILNPRYYSSNDMQIEGSISPDCSYIAIIAHRKEPRKQSSIHICDILTGKQLIYTEIPQRPGSVSLKESEVWYMGGTWGDDNEPVKGWKIVDSGRSGVHRLEPIEITAHPLQEFPWQSCLGYKVTYDGWVLSPTQKRLLWLPHHWRSKEKFKKWSGRFLGLVHMELPEVVILEFLE